MNIAIKRLRDFAIATVKGEAVFQDDINFELAAAGKDADWFAGVCELLRRRRQHVEEGEGLLAQQKEIEEGDEQIAAARPADDTDRIRAESMQKEFGEGLADRLKELREALLYSSDREVFELAHYTRGRRDQVKEFRLQVEDLDLPLQTEALLAIEQRLDHEHDELVAKLFDWTYLNIV